MAFLPRTITPPASVQRIRLGPPSVRTHSPRRLTHPMNGQPDSLLTATQSASSSTVTPDPLAVSSLDPARDGLPNPPVSLALLTLCLSYCAAGRQRAHPCPAITPTGNDGVTLGTGIEARLDLAKLRGCSQTKNKNGEVGIAGGGQSICFASPSSKSVQLSPSRRWRATG